VVGAPEQWKPGLMETVRAALQRHL